MKNVNFLRRDFPKSYCKGWEEATPHSRQGLCGGENDLTLPSPSVSRVGLHGFSFLFLERSQQMQERSGVVEMAGPQSSLFSGVPCAGSV